MTQEDKQLLLKDLCARLPYGVICRYEAIVPLFGEVLNYGPLQEIRQKGEYFTINGAACLYDDIKPYLRPMSSMTEEEISEIEETLKCVCGDDYYTHIEGDYQYDTLYSSTDWLNAHHFDYRGLIEKGLALEAPDGMYKTE